MGDLQMTDEKYNKISITREKIAKTRENLKKAKDTIGKTEGMRVHTDYKHNLYLQVPEGICDILLMIITSSLKEELLKLEEEYEHE